MTFFQFFFFWKQENNVLYLISWFTFPPFSFIITVRRPGCLGSLYFEPEPTEAQQHFKILILWRDRVTSNNLIRAVPHRTESSVIRNGLGTTSDIHHIPLIVVMMMSCRVMSWSWQGPFFWTIWSIHYTESSNVAGFFQFIHSLYNILYFCSFKISTQSCNVIQPIKRSDLKLKLIWMRMIVNEMQINCHLVQQFYKCMYIWCIYLTTWCLIISISTNKKSRERNRYTRVIKSLIYFIRCPIRR